MVLPKPPPAIRRGGIRARRCGWLGPLRLRQGWLRQCGCRAGLAGPAGALPLNIPVPANATIIHNGLVWSWAGPCNPVSPSCGVIDLTFQSQFGWRLATAQEIVNHPLATDFRFPGANVPLGGSDPNGAVFLGASPGGDAACSAPYFSTAHSHCDWSDGVNNFWAGLPGTLGTWEGLVVRAIPEPSTALLLASGLAAIAVGRRRRAQ